MPAELHRQGKTEISLLMNRRSRPDRSSLTNDVYFPIREAILNAKLPPGTPISGRGGVLYETAPREQRRMPIYRANQLDLNFSRAPKNHREAAHGDRELKDATGRSQALLFNWLFMTSGLFFNYPMACIRILPLSRRATAPSPREKPCAFTRAI